MKQKQIIVLALILSALFLAVLTKSIIQNWKYQETGGPQVYGALSFELQPKAVEKILIGRGEKKQSVSLVKTGGIWKVENLWDAAASTEKIDFLIKKMQEAKGELRGARKILFKDFGIEDGDAFFLKFIGSSGRPVLDLRIGIQTPGAGGCFLREAGSDEVYFADISVSELLGLYTALNEAEPRADFWADLTLFRLRPDRVASVAVRKGTNTVLEVRRENTGEDLSKNPWSFVKAADPQKGPDPEKVLRFLAVLNSVQAQTVVDPAGKDYGLEAPFLEIRVTEKDSQEVQTIIGPQRPKEEFCFVKISGRPEIFKLKAHYLQDLEMTDEKLVKETPASSNPPKTS